MKKIYIVVAISIFLTLNFYTNVLAGNEEEVFKTEINKLCLH